MASNTLQTNLCLICNATCSSNRNTIQVFNVNKLDQSIDKNVEKILSNLLHVKVIQNSPLIDSQVVCKKCYKLIDEFGDLQIRLDEIRKELNDSYNLSYEKRQQQQQQLLQNKTNENQNLILPIEIIDGSTSTSLAPPPLSKNIENDKIHVKSFFNEMIITNNDKKQLIIEENDVENVNINLVNDNENIIEVNQAAIEIDSQQFNTLISNGVETMELCTDENDTLHMIKLEPQSLITAPSSSSSSFIHPKPLNSIKKPPLIEHYKRDDQREHMSTIVRQAGKEYICLMCTDEQQPPREPKDIINHMKEIHDTRLYICDICGMHFNKRNFLSAHVDDHVENEEGDFQCEICNRIFNNLRLFRIHRRMHRPRVKLWQCKNCTKKFSSQNLLIEHMNMHLGIRPYICQMCGKDFASKYIFRAHEKTHIVCPKKFTCTICNQRYSSEHNFMLHKQTHLITTNEDGTGSTVDGLGTIPPLSSTSSSTSSTTTTIQSREYQCHLCNKQFGSAHNLEVHSIVHTGFKPYICNICGKSFARKAEIRDHERTHTGERPYQCEFCGSTFSQRSNLQSHKRATHYNDKRYRCQECGKKFKRRRLLDYHIKAAHTGERPYKCETCGSTFVYPEHFKKHRRIHTGEKPFLCEVCGKAFNSRDNRNAHRFVHSDKKPYECLDCGTGFMRKPLLYQHMQLLGHVNDTIVINQPRVALDDKLLLSESDLMAVNHVIDDCDGELESKVFITEDDTNGIIIDGQPVIKIAQHISDNDNNINGDDDEDDDDDDDDVIDDDDDDDHDNILGKVHEVIATDAEYDEIIETSEGQLVKVKIPNDNGVEEEAWIKIVEQ